MVGAQACCAHLKGRDKFAPLRMPRRIVAEATDSHSLQNRKLALTENTAEKIA